jgi:hypothetical protein
MAFKNQLWQAIASGLLETWRAELASITNVDSRALLQSRGVWSAWLTETSWAAMGHVVTEQTVGLLTDEIPDPVYEPVIRDQVSIGKPPRVTGAETAGGDTLIADDPGASYEVWVFSWDSGAQEFTEVGALSDNAQPGAGYYVLACTFAGNPGEQFGLPNNNFLELTA